MDASHEKYIDRLTEILHKKQVLLQDILGFTKSQTAAIDEESLEKLQKLIEDKQVRIETIDKLDEEFNVYFQRLKSTLKINSLAELDVVGSPKAIELKAATSGILKLITDIADIEKVNNEKSQKLLKNFGNEIKNLNQNKKVNSAYTPAPFKLPSYFIDKKK